MVKYVNSIKFGENGETYVIKDSSAQAAIENMLEGDTFVETDQGIENAGKLLSVDNNGKVVPTTVEIPSVEGLASEQYVDSAIEEVEGKIPSIEGLASEQYVDSALEGKQNVLTAGTNITIENDVISATGGAGASSFSELVGDPMDNSALADALNAKADASDLQSLEDEVDTKQDVIDSEHKLAVALVDGALTASDIAGKADSATTLAGYGIEDAYTKTEVDGLIPSISGLATEQYVDDAIDEVEGKIPDVSDLATKAEVEAVEQQIPSIDGLATETYVNNAVSGKQDTLENGVNIKTINNQSILGSGNITISGGGGSGSSLSTHRAWIAPKKGSAEYTTLVESETTGTLIGSDGLFSQTFSGGNTLTYTHNNSTYSSILVTTHKAGNFSSAFYLVSIFDKNNNLVYLSHGTTKNDVFKLELGDTIRCCSTSSFALYKLDDADVFDLDNIGDTASDITALQTDVGQLQTDVAQLQLDVIQPVYSELTLENFATGWMKANGTIVTSPGGGKSQRCVVDGYDKIYLTGNSSLSPGAGWALYWFEDDEENVITSSIQNYTQAQAALNPKVRYLINVPANAYYFRVSQQVSTVEVISESVKTNQFVGELAEDIGDLTTLTTTEKSSLVGAINEIDADVTTIQGQLANIDTTPNQWKGKKIVWMGTSIPAGQHSTINYPTLIGTALGATVINVAVPGCGVESSAEGSPNTPKSSGSFANTVAEYTTAGISSVGNKSYENAMLGKDADLYVFDYEPNNSRPGTELVENFNLVSWKYNDNSTLASHRDTYAGGMIYLIDQLLTEKPTAKIVMVSECVTNSAYAITANLAASKAIAEKFHIPLIELGSRLYYNGKNWSYYFHDYIHPNEAGHQRIANILMHELLLVG